MVVQNNHLLGNQTTLAVLFVSDNHLIMLYGLDSLKNNWIIRSVSSGIILYWFLSLVECIYISKYISAVK